jgi:hypothetical protein
LKSEQSHLLRLHEETQKAINEDEEFHSDLISSRSSAIEEAKEKMMDMETIKVNLLEQFQVAHNRNENT